MKKIIKWFGNRNRLVSVIVDARCSNFDAISALLSLVCLVGSFAIANTCEDELVSQTVLIGLSILCILPVFFAMKKEDE